MWNIQENERSVDQKVCVVESEQTKLEVIEMGGLSLRRLEVCA
jgi:hypothetical protein